MKQSVTSGKNNNVDYKSTGWNIILTKQRNNNAVVCFLMGQIVCMSVTLNSVTEICRLKDQTTV